MTETDEYFPRGKVPPAVSKAKAAGETVTKERRPKGRFSNDADNLFKSYHDKPKDKKKLKKSKNALTAAEEKSLGGKRSSQQEKRFAVVPLNYDQIVEGMLSLAIITKIRDHEIYVNMPGRTSGHVSITDISTPYVKVLEAHTAGVKDIDDETPIYPLREMFQVGQCVVVKVKSVQRLESKLKVALTMNPKDVNSNYNTTVLKEDLVILAAVASIEDHGYQMDVGINGARCFLSKEDARKHIQNANQKRPLGIGEILYCKINKIQFHRLIANIQLTTFAKAVRSQKMDDIIGLNYSTLIPGMLVDAVVMETHQTGLMTYCMELNGLVHQDHMENEWTQPESLEVGSNVAARVLYVLPNLTTPYLTMQSNLVPLSQHRNRCDKGTLLGSKQNVRVVQVEKRGITVRFEGDGSKGIIPINHLGDESLLTVEDISKKYKKGSVHECRVLQQSPIERVYLCSLRKDKMENDFVHSEQALPGKNMSCRILRWNNGGAIVQFGSGMNGFVPNPLFRSEKLTDAAKEKLIGTTHKARILSRDSEKDKIVLTVRKELVTSNGAVISTLEEAEKGMIGHAIIKHCGKAAAFVTTIGGVEGFVPATKLSKIKLADLRDAFRSGQIVQYKVLEVIPDRNQLLMTTILDTASDSEDEDEVEQLQDKKKSKKRTRADSQNGDTSTESKKKRKKRGKKKSKKANNDHAVVEEEKSDDEDEAMLQENGDDEMDVSLNLPKHSNFWETSTTEQGEPDSDSDENPSRSRKLRKVKSTTKEVNGKPIVNDAASVTADSLDAAEKYENGVISSPDDPLYWVKLMSHYTSVGIVEKARGVAKQALDTINYRNEKGKLKVWGALFNLEIKHGTEDTLKAVVADALQRTDQFECYKILALVYDKADRFKDAERIYRNMAKQFRLEPDAWIRFGTFYFNRQKGDAGRALLNEALSVIPLNKQVLLITQFALLELHHGEQNRGESMMDRVLAQYPQRCDMWLLYANALIKHGDYDRARNVFHKAFQISWNPRKVKPLLKRFQEFESTHGNADTLAEFQNLALKVLNVSNDD